MLKEILLGLAVVLIVLAWHFGSKDETGENAMSSALTAVVCVLGAVVACLTAGGLWLAGN